jgi:hypothetical protein
MIPTSLSASGGNAGPSAANNRQGDVGGSTASAGNRGFINNVAFPGSTQSIDQALNPGLGSGGVGGMSWGLIASIAAVAVAAWYFLRR